MKMINAAKNFHLLPDWSSEIIPVELMSRSMHKESKVYIVGGEVHQKVSTGKPIKASRARSQTVS